MRTFLVVCLSLIIASTLFSAATGNSAAIPDGSPGSPNFGYGARLDPSGDQVEVAIKISGQFALDWIAIEFDWANLQPKSTIPPDWETLDNVIMQARENHLAVMMSISDPPNWAITQIGPDPLLTTSLCRELVQRYSNTLQALEIFPGANTIEGWGTQPNPKNYTTLLKSIHNSFEKKNAGVVLVAGGLLPITEKKPSGSIDDLIFLEGLYTSGAAPFMPIVGIQLPSISANPTTPPDPKQGITLRHYEAIRNIMLENNHQSGLIWVTGFSWNSQMIDSSEEQALWIKQAYLMMRRQLYIGAAFFQNLNPSSHHSQEISLVNLNADLHPGFDAIGQIIAEENSSQTITFEWTVAENNFPQPIPNR